MYYGARWYDPELGRFISEDPATADPNDPLSINRYIYCRNNPLIYTDPTGMFFGIDDLIFAAVKIAVDVFIAVANWAAPIAATSYITSFAMAEISGASFEESTRAGAQAAGNPATYATVAVFQVVCWGFEQVTKGLDTAKDITNPQTTSQTNGQSGQSSVNSSPGVGGDATKIDINVPEMKTNVSMTVKPDIGATSSVPGVGDVNLTGDINGTLNGIPGEAYKKAAVAVTKIACREIVAQTASQLFWTGVNVFVPETGIARVVYTVGRATLKYKRYDDDINDLISVTK
jgi:hypothetical protein